MEFTIKNRVISRQDDTDTIGYNGDYVCTFSVDAEWAGKTITARFVDASKQIREVLLVDGQCTAPLMGAAPVCVGVYAAGMTSTYIGVYYATSIKDLGGVTAPPAPDIYNQILGYLDESVAQVELSADATAGSALGAAQSLQSTLQASADAQRAISESEAAAVGAVTTAGESAIAAVGGSAVSGINSVNTARDNALTSVADSSATAVGAIETAQGSAVAAVGTKETEALGAIDAAVEEVEAEVAQISANASAIAAINTALNNDYASAIKPTVSGASINLTDSADAPIQDLKVYGNSTQDGTPTPDAPIDIVSVGDSGSVDVTVCGKNALNTIVYKAVTNMDLQSQDIVIPANLKPMWTNKPFGFAFFEKNVTYTFKGTIGYGRVSMNTSDSSVPSSANVPSTSLGTVATSLITSALSSRTFTSNENQLVYFWYCSDASNTGSNSSFTVYPQLEVGTSATPYEPYKSQTITIPLAEPLSGVGDYKDTICEQDGQIGVLRNIAKNIIDGKTSKASSVTKPSWATCVNTSFSTINLVNRRNLMCNGTLMVCGSLWVNNSNNTDLEHIYAVDNANTLICAIFDTRTGGTLVGTNTWFANNNVTLLYPLETPTFEPLSNEIQSQWRALKTYYPTTNIINTDSANMDCLYVADTKNYIDNKLLELTANMVDLATMQMLDN